MSLTAGDRYCYPETGVLKNRLDIRDADLLDEASNEYASLAWVLFRQSPPEELDFTYLRDAHFFMFGRVFEWAGHLRDTSLSPAGVNRDYCDPAAMEARLVEAFEALENNNYLTGLDEWDFCVGLADVWAELTYIHPFRDGNTRSQSLWASELATRAGHELDWTKIDPVHLRDARLASWNGFPGNLADYLHERLLPPGSSPVNPGFVDAPTT